MRQVTPAISKIFLLFTLMLVLAGCGGQNDYTTQTTVVDGVTIGFEHPTKAELLKTYDVFVTLKDANGQTINGADVVIDMDMPAMSMGTSRPVADSAGDGRYRISTAYSMDGDWVITVEAAVDGNVYRATFDQMVQPQG